MLLCGVAHFVSAYVKFLARVGRVVFFPANNSTAAMDKQELFLTSILLIMLLGTPVCLIRV